MWLVAVVGRCVVGCERVEQSDVVQISYGGKTKLRERESSWTRHNLKYVHFLTLNLYTMPV